MAAEPILQLALTVFHPNPKQSLFNAFTYCNTTALKRWKWQRVLPSLVFKRQLYATSFVNQKLTVSELQLIVKVRHECYMAGDVVALHSRRADRLCEACTRNYLQNTPMLQVCRNQNR